MNQLGIFYAYQKLPGSIYKQLRETAIEGVLLYVPDYLEFVLLKQKLKADGAQFLVPSQQTIMRNYLTEQFQAVTEYTSQSALSRARTEFFHGEVPIMVYTGAGRHLINSTTMLRLKV